MLDKIIPSRLQQGDEIRIVAPSCSLSILEKKDIIVATKTLEKMGFKVTFGKHVNEINDFYSSSIHSRVEDLHEAFADINVKMVLPVIGGFNCNQLFTYIDWGLIKNNPKILGGYSDTTALQNAIYTKTGLITFQSPSFSSFARVKNNEYSLEYFQKCFVESKEINIKASKFWDDADWYEDSRKSYQLIRNQGHLNIQSGKAKGNIIGGNLCTLNLLQGTEYMPKFEEDTILFLEDDYEGKAANFDRDLVSLIQQPGFANVKGLVIGRFQKESETTDNLLTQIIQTKAELENISVIANVDFGHTYPFFSFPIGGQCRIDNGKIVISW
ncbi:MAG: LD-carboxypeptidase [candidate division SR1 bacterium]|nr:LD-carboxypeptidase [candidate division SR1 bacterium]